MKNIWIKTALLALFIIPKASAQTDSTVTIDQLQTPSSPAFNMLGINPEDIERPKNPTDFALSLANATQNFSLIPKSYAVEFAPYWVFGGKKSSFKDFISNDNIGRNILQTMTISAATTTKTSAIDTAMQYNQVAVAIKFSILRGKVGKDFTKWNDSASHYLAIQGREVRRILDSLMGADSEYVALNAQLTVIVANKTLSAAEKVSLSKTLSDLMSQRHDALNTQANALAQQQAQANVAVLNGLASRTDFRRDGWKLDFAFGTVLDYPTNSFQSCYVSDVAGWFTGGYEHANQFNVLGVARLSENFYHKILNDSAASVTDVNIGNLDLGIRIYRDVTTKYTLSFEYITRMAVFYDANTLKANNISVPKTTNRYILSMNYKVGKNQNIGFSVGKNFDNSLIKSSTGDLVAALSLGLGFGSQRPAK